MKRFLEKIIIDPEVRKVFIHMCGNWKRYCYLLSTFNKQETLELIKYLVDERPYSKNLLDRAISRFNRLNMLKREDLI